MMSNSIGLQRLKPVHTAYCGLHNLAENWSWARDVNGRDRDETETSASQDRDVDNFSRDETATRRWYVSRPSRDRDIETKTTTLVCDFCTPSDSSPMQTPFIICLKPTIVCPEKATKMFFSL